MDYENSTSKEELGAKKSEEKYLQDLKRMK